MIVRPRQTGQMDVAERAVALDKEGTRLIEVVVADPAADIPTCPGWQATTLLGHIASGWEALRVIVESASIAPPDFSVFAAAPEGHDDLVAFAQERHSRLVATLAEADPELPLWTWSGEKNAAFYQRRAHLETVVHRVDAELGAGMRTPVDPAVGIDAVDELFSVMLAGVTESLPSGSLHLHQTDGDGEFMLTVADGTISVSHEHAKGDAALRATGDELMTVMWNRRSLDGLELFGDRAVVEQWAALAP